MAQELDLILSGVDAAKYLLKSCCGISCVKKAFSLSSKTGFDKAVSQMASTLRRLSSPSERDAVADAVGVLDVDWLSTTADERARLVNDAMVQAGAALSLIPAKIEGSVEGFARDVVGAGRESARGAGASIAVDFNATDEKIIDFLTSSNSLYISDEHGRRINDMGEKARTIIADGVSEGLGREEISSRLRAAATSAASGRSEFYWEVLSAAFVSRGRSLAQMSAYEEAGIEKYQLEAVLDEATTDYCRSVHGLEFSVKTGLSNFERIAELDDAAQIKETSPWVRETTNPDGSVDMWVRGSDGEKVSVGTVSESAVGTADKIPKVESLKTPPQLSSLGIGLPPFHGLCRTTTIPVLS